MNIKTISGGYQVPDDSCLGKFQLETDRLDHDRHLVPLACEYIKPGMTVLDCGGFNGDHSIAYRRAASGGIVISVEANPFTFEMLRHNMRQQTHNEAVLADSYCVNAAVSDEIGYGLGKIATGENLGASNVILMEKYANENYAIPFVSVDFLCKIYNTKIHFLKLDVEGFELSALKGASYALEFEKPTLLIEVCDANLKRQGHDADQLFKFLAAKNYAWTIAQPQCNEQSEIFDIVCTPK